MKENQIEYHWLPLLIRSQLKKYLDLKSLIELSLINRYSRDGLKSNLFNTISLKGSVFREYFNYADYETSLCYSVEHFNSYMVNDSSVYDLDNLRRLDTDLVIKSMDSSLSGLKEYANHIKFCDIKHLGYFAFPLIYSLKNLAHLELTNCSIPLIGLFKLSQYLPILKILTLNRVKIVNGKNLELSLQDLTLPAQLEDLTLTNCTGYSISLINPTVYSLAYIYEECLFEEFSILKHMEIPSLKKLNFYHFDLIESYLPSFLLRNLQLKSLETASGFLCQNTLNIIAYDISDLSELKVLGDLTFYRELNIPTLANLKTLKIGNFKSYSFQKAFELCKNCPNLVNLTLDFSLMIIEMDTFNRFLSNSVSKLISLRNLEILILWYNPIPLDIYKLYNIETLRIEGTDRNLLDIIEKDLPAQLRYCRVICWDTDEIYEFKK
jgi:hypothetical protein